MTEKEKWSRAEKLALIATVLSAIQVILTTIAIML